MPKALHQRSLTYRVLRKWLPVYRQHINNRNTVLTEYGHHFKMPKGITKKNILRYSKMIKALDLLIAEIEKETHQ